MHRDALEPVRSYRTRGERLLIGLMTGTSADATDAVLVRVTGDGLEATHEVLGELDAGVAAMDALAQLVHAERELDREDLAPGERGAHVADLARIVQHPRQRHVRDARLVDVPPDVGEVAHHQLVRRAARRSRPRQPIEVDDRVRRTRGVERRLDLVQRGRLAHAHRPRDQDRPRHGGSLPAGSRGIRYHVRRRSGGRRVPMGPEIGRAHV